MFRVKSDFKLPFRGEGGGQRMDPLCVWACFEHVFEDISGARGSETSKELTIAFYSGVGRVIVKFD